MSDEKVLTKEIAEQFLADEESVGLSECTAIEDAAAKSLSRYEGTSLFLAGLTSLSDTAAESLGKYKGYFYGHLMRKEKLSSSEDESKLQAPDISGDKSNNAVEQVMSAIRATPRKCSRQILKSSLSEALVDSPSSAERTSSRSCSTCCRSSILYSP
jgi:hypothetical protein